jgi:hypothetical protein
MGIEKKDIIDQSTKFLRFLSASYIFLKLDLKVSNDL